MVLYMGEFRFYYYSALIPQKELYSMFSHLYYYWSNFVLVFGSRRAVVFFIKILFSPWLKKAWLFPKALLRNLLTSMFVKARYFLWIFFSGLWRIYLSAAPISSQIRAFCMCFKVFASLSSCLRWGQVEPIDWKPSEPLSKSLSLPVRFVPMEPSSVLQAVLQKHGRAGMMDHLRPTHKDDCPSTLLWQGQCFVSLLSWFLPEDQTDATGETQMHGPLACGCGC